MAYSAKHNYFLFLPPPPPAFDFLLVVALGVFSGSCHEDEQTMNTINNRDCCIRHYTEFMILIPSLKHYNRSSPHAHTRTKKEIINKEWEAKKAQLSIMICYTKSFTRGLGCSYSKSYISITDNTKFVEWIKCNKDQYNSDWKVHQQIQPHALKQTPLPNGEECFEPRSRVSKHRPPLSLEPEE